MPAPRNVRQHPDATGLDGLSGDPFAILMAAEGATADEMLAATVASLNAYRPSFHDLANCQGSDVDFYSKKPDQRAAAFALCGACDVRLECRDWADEVDDRDAILGGEDWPARRARQKRSGHAQT